MAPTLVDANAFEELATRSVPMGITWTTKAAGADADKPHLAAKAVTIMDTATATATTVNTPVITTTRQRAATGAANTKAGTPKYDDPELNWNFSAFIIL